MLATSPTQAISLVHDLSLIAQETPIAPIGTPSHVKSPIGLASVFLQLRNPLKVPQTLVIESIQIVNVETGRVEMIKDTAQSITLMPLEHAIVDIHLNLQTGYTESGEVKAIATYTITDAPLPQSPPHQEPTRLVYGIESAPVEIL